MTIDSKYFIFLVRLLPTFSALVVFAPIAALAAIPLGDGVAYTQDFNSMTDSIVSVTPPNPPTDWVYTTDNDPNPEVVNFGNTSDRALGQGGVNVFTGSFGASFEILTGGSTVGLAISFTGEQWYHGSGASKILDFEFSRDATSLSTGTWAQFDALDFDDPIGSLPLGAQETDGNLPQYRTGIFGTLSLQNVTDGEIIWIRWTGKGASDGGTSDGLAVDDFSITSTATGNSGTAPQIVSITYDPESNLTTITYQSIDGEALGVQGSDNLFTFPDILPDTPIGDGTIKSYTHNPPSGTNRYFYRMIRTTP